MEDDKIKEDTEGTDEQFDTDDSPDGGFMRGYEEDEVVIECAECGTAVKEEKKLTRKIGDEEYFFCSKTCAHDFEESMVQE